MILIIADEVDSHARRVRDILGERGHEAAILDFARLSGSASYYHEIGPWGRRRALALDRVVDFDDVRTIWIRRPSVAGVPDRVVELTARSFIRHEWAEALNAMTQTLDVRWVNDPIVQATAGKPLQLDVALAAGMAVPDTLITNDAGRARAFVDQHVGRVVHKSLTTPQGRLMDTRLWDPATDGPQLGAALPLAPVVFQEYVTGPADVRTVITGDRTFSVAVDLVTSRAGIDSRLDLDADCVPYELPTDVATRLLEVMARLGLVFGVADLRIDDDGQHVFFEINPQGQFLFMEILTGLPISAAVATLLGERED